MEKNYESIKNKLLKLQALVERGCEGEAANAKRLIDAICLKYGFSFDEILNEGNKTDRFIINIGRSYYAIDLLTQCYCLVTGKDRIGYFKVSGSKYIIECTKLQFIEISNMLKFHLANYKKELNDIKKTLLEAYLYKHNLLGTKSDEKADKELSLDEMEHILKVIRMQSSLSDRYYHKLITNQ